jgi:glutathione S-transferase
MYQLFIGNKNYSSWSLRPWALMRELQIPFEEHVVPFEPGSSWQAFRTFSPTGKVPCLQDGSTVVWDSLGITEYLAERHRNVWPADAATRAWARCAVAEMHSSFGVLRERCTMNCGIRVRLREIPDTLRADVDRLSELWEEGLARFGGPFLAGKAFTAVDAFFTPVAFRIQTYGLGLRSPAADYAVRLLALPSLESWYSDALAERWREPAHEEEAKRTGTWTADLRAGP